MNHNTALIAVKKILKDNLFKRRIISDSGTIEGTRLAFYKTSQALFTRPTKEKGRKYHIELIVDVSGSMEGDKIHCALIAAKNVANLLKHIAIVRIKLFNMVTKTYLPDEFIQEFFTRRGSNPNKPKYMWYLERCCYFYKKDGKTYILAEGEEPPYGSVKSMRPEYSSYEDDEDYKDDDHYFYEGVAAGNRELCNVQASYNYLRKKDGDKLIIVMLDGMMSMDPLGGNGAARDHPDCIVDGLEIGKYNYNNYIQTVRKIESEMPLYAIGIMTEEPKKYYANFIHIQKPEQIYKEIVGIMKKTIIG